MEDKFSELARKLRPSPIRELLKLINEPDIISFAGGIPDPTLFPIDLMWEVTQQILENEGDKALQYGPSDGDMGLREEISKWLKDKEGVDIPASRILPTTASQQGLDLIGKVFINPGDYVIVGLPTYLGALAAFSAYGVQFIGIPLDDEGMQVELIPEKLKKLRRAQKRVKFVYVVPDFQNPAGVTMSLQRRKRLIEIAEKYDFLIVEDTPYRELRYSGKHVPPFMALGAEERVISLYSFSKILFPGLRVGFVIAAPNVIRKLILAKQAADLCSPVLTQFVVREILKRRDAFKRHIMRLVVRYRDKRDAMLSALVKYFHDIPGVKWTKPEGGLFLWLTFPEGLDTEKMFPKALENKVAYIIGTAFHFDGSGKNTARLNFSYPTMKQIDEGIQRLSKVVEAELRELERKKRIKLTV